MHLRCALEEASSRPSTPVSTPAPPKEAAAAPAPATRGNQRGKPGPASRGGRYYSRGGKKPSSPQEKENQEAADETTGESKKFEGEGRGRGRGRGRGDRARGRGRPFDRHSQTGKTDSEKKVHQGWGGDEGNSELKAETAAVADAAAESGDAWGVPETSQWDVPAPAADAAPAEGEKPADGRRSREREPEEEDNTLTLDEYLKQRKGLEIVPQLETRKANEGDDSIWKDAVVVNKKVEEETAYFVGKSKSSAPKPAKKKEEKVFLEIDARFERPSRGGRGRGDRGVERGTRGRGRGGNRGRANGNSSPALNVADETAFPSLS